MFLPAIKNCGDTIYPVEVPFVLPPYLVGLVLALAAIFHSRRALRRALLAIRLLTVAMFVLGLLLVSSSIAMVVIVILTSVLFWWALGLRKNITSAAYQLARGGVCASVVFIAWFALWCCDPSSDALFGLWLSLASSIGLLIGTLIWAVEANEPLDDDPVPSAHARFRA